MQALQLSCSLLPQRRSPGSPHSGSNGSQPSLRVLVPVARQTNSEKTEANEDAWVT